NVNNVNNSGPGECTVIDLPRQMECNPGYKCTIMEVDGSIGCVNNGPLSIGDVCVPISPGVTQDGCPALSVCVPKDSELGICQAYCEALYYPCPREGEICYTEVDVDGGTAKICEPADECDPYWNPSLGADARYGCAADEFCYGFMAGEMQRKCVSENDSTKVIGDKLKGEPCSESLDCAPGHVCFGSPTEAVCSYLCNTQEDCGIDYCTRLSPDDEYGLCM
ncbi:hypothetical protein KKF84_14030, partial [Myxococcota bacterium]|nr:hypothetical protein [Myxococcota bacterium]